MFNYFNTCKIMVHVEKVKLCGSKLIIIEEYPTFAVYDEDGTLVLVVRRHILADKPDDYTLLHCSMCSDNFRSWTRQDLLDLIVARLFGMNCVEVFKTEHILIPSLTISEGMLQLMGLPSHLLKK